MMECNKEEAARAKGAAETKVQGADYAGAKRMALKAHKLFPGLENICQLIAVCEVHCCASVKISGETDWYAVLQVESTADDMVLKKQYRKLTLLLHPDKNKFAGAEAAFKLIGEAHMTLTDQVKRSSHDKKRKPVFTTSAPPLKKRRQAPKKNDSKRANKGKVAFWTICLTCGTKYQYPCSALMKFVMCQICSSTFLAYDLQGNIISRPPEPGCRYRMQPQKFPSSQQARVTNQKQKYQTVPGWQTSVTSHQTHTTYQQKQSWNVPDQQTPGANQQQQQSQKLSSNVGSRNVVSSQNASNLSAKAGRCTSKKVPAAAAASNQENCAGRTESPLATSYWSTGRSY